MSKAWVITQEGTQTNMTVIGILSGRKSGNTIKDYVEWLYALMNYFPEEHLRLARYNNPANPYGAEYWRTNTGVQMQTKMTCGHNPWLEARLATNVRLVVPQGEDPILEWTESNRLVCDRNTLRVVEKMPGNTIRAPVNLPLRIGEPP